MSTNVINSVGWYLINTCENNLTIESVVNSYKNNELDTIIIYPYAYYFIGSWPNDKTFTNDDWLTVDIYSDMLTNVSYWILIQEYNIVAPEPEPEPEPQEEILIQPEPQPEPEQQTAQFITDESLDIDMSSF
tara:strand:- start:259 stop:654 length:396 start_codon:yes stop_codon:yes gene_type:complete